MSGWTGLVAKFNYLYGLLNPKRALRALRKYNKF